MKISKIILLAAVSLILVSASVYAAKMKKDKNVVQEMEFAKAEKNNQQIDELSSQKNLAASSGKKTALIDTSAETQFVIELKENKFVPDTLEVPVGKDFKLIVKNLDKTIEEFESTDLKKEKLVKGGKEIVLRISALKAGEYKFFGEFHPRTAQGRIVAK